MSTPAGELRQVAVITGGEGTLARAVTRELTDAGWYVHAPGKATLDVTSAASVSAYFSGLSRLDLLVCAAGITHDRLAISISAEDWENVLSVNLDGAARCAISAARVMAGQGAGHIVFISSHSALTGNPGQCAYTSAKAALAGLTGSLARDLGPSGIRVNCLLPGFFESKLTGALTAAARQRLLDDHALPHTTTPQDTARFLACLHTLRAVSGQIFHLDSRIARWS